MPASAAASLSTTPVFRPSLEDRSHGSLLRELLGVQGFSEGGRLVGVGGHDGGPVGDGVRRRSGTAEGRIHVLPCEQVSVAAR